MAKVSKFSQDLAAGRVGEQLAADYMTKLGYEIQDVSHDTQYFSKDIDLLAEKNGVKMSIEVKSDYNVSKTGNVVIETCTNVGKKKPGWWYYTEATHLFFVDVRNSIIHCVRRDELKQVLNQHKSELKRRRLKTLENGVYQKESEIVLVPIRLFRELKHYIRLTPEFINQHKQEE